MELYYRAWRAASPRGAIVLFHRGHEHSGRFQEMVDLLAMEQFSMFAWDARGHGRSPGDRGYAESFGCVVRDMNTFVRHIHQHYGHALEDISVVAHSVGAVAASAWVHDYAPPIRCLVLASPAFRVRLYIPFAMLCLRMQTMVRKKAFVKSYVRPQMLTHDAAECESYRRDPLIARSIAVNILIGMHDTATRVMNDASAIVAPTLLLSSGKDWVVTQPPQRKFYESIASTRKRMVEYPGFFHDLFHESDRRQPIAATRAFLLDAYDNPAAKPDFIAGQRNRDQYERLSKPSAADLFWGMQKLFLKTVGKLSRGIQIGWRHGFDSGESLDHVYLNHPQGTTPLGKLIDAIYLNSPGWKGIRQRRLHMEQMLEHAIRQGNGKHIHILDVAASGGRYVLETLARTRDIPVSATLRDWSASNVDAARKLAAELKLKEVRVERGDAFDRASLAALSPRPTIAIVSGLFELFPDNSMVARCLDGIADSLEDGGLLLYTNQPWHPQLEMIARVLQNREGKPWVMRCRAQAEMDELVSAAGFEKLEMRIDEEGIFTVSLARRRERPHVDR